MLSIQQAFEQIAEHVAPLNQETIPLAYAVGRVLSSDVFADVDSPPHRKSVMDGFAVRSKDAVRVSASIGSPQRKQGASENTVHPIDSFGGEGESDSVRLKIVETIAAGGWPKRELVAGETARIMTGAPLPIGADGVVMVELTKVEALEMDGAETGFVLIKSDLIQAGKHVIERAANFATGQQIFSAGYRIRPHDIGLLAEVGAANVNVFKRPTVAILPTGDELVGCNSLPERGQIRNSNGPLLIALAQSLGLNIIDLGIGRDDRDDLTEKIRNGLQHHLLILSGGVSAGILDLVPGILQQEGVTEIFHQVNMKPGKPIWFGVLKRPEQTCYVFGLPGNPVSSLVGFLLFVRAAIARMENCPAWQPAPITALLSQSHETRGDRPTLWPGRWVAGNDASTENVAMLASAWNPENVATLARAWNPENVATLARAWNPPAHHQGLAGVPSATRWIEPLDWQGSSDLRTLSAADGLIYFSGEQHQHAAGAAVSVIPL